MSKDRADHRHPREGGDQRTKDTRKAAILRTSYETLHLRPLGTPGYFDSRPESVFRKDRSNRKEPSR